MKARRLTRSAIDRVFGGVCGGVATYLQVPSWWVRALWILLALFTLGTSLVIYGLLWLLLPQQTLAEALTVDSLGRTQGRPETLILLGTATIGLGLVILAVSLGVLQGAQGDILLPLALLLLGFVLLAQQVRKPL